MDTVTMHFSWLDYSMFFAMLALSALIGVYFGFFGKKQDSPEEYLHGGKKMKIFPIASSLIASDISGITLLGVPADIYTFGSSYSIAILANMIMVAVITYVFLPVFYKLQVTSSYEYLKLRFSNRVCVMGSFIFALSAILWLPIVIYTPALALSQVSGLELNVIIPVVSLICIFYTTIGGIKAVVWTDTMQMFVMIGSLVVVFFLGISVEGGFAAVWNKAYEGGRIDLNLSADPTRRTASITILIGLTSLFCGAGTNPVVTQRFLAVPTIRDAKITAVIFSCGSVIFKIFACSLGLVIYSHYSDCAPLKSGQIQKPDQILPLYIMEVSSALPGLPGLFIAGVFCAALSTMSSGLNTMAGTIYEDFIKSRMPKDTSDKHASDVMKIIVVIVGLLMMLLVFLVQYLGAILQLSMIIAGIVVGPMLAVFALGMLVPLINEKGILYGAAGGFLFMLWVILMGQYYALSGRIPSEALFLSTESCDAYSANITTATTQSTMSQVADPPFFLFRISFFLYSVVGSLAAVMIALPVSLFTGGHKQLIDRDLLSPVIYPLLSRKHQSKLDINAKELVSLTITEKNES